MNFWRSGDNVFVNGEQFSIDDLMMLYPKYSYTAKKSHFYDGKKHYVSNGRDQMSCPVPYPLAEELSTRLPELRMCKSQRINDHKYFENLRNAGR